MLLRLVIASGYALACLVAAPPAWSEQKQAAPTATLKDTSRLVIAGGAITEVVYALGLGDRIVGIDTTSLHPAEALKTKRNVGYFRALSSEGVLSLAPSAILASDKAGPPEVVRALKSSPVPFIEIDDRPDPSALVERIRMIARVLGHEDRGETLGRKVEEGFAEVEAMRRQIRQPLNVLFVFSVQGGRITTGGRGTAADAMLRLAGARNVAGSVDGYKPVTEEAVIGMAPDAIVIANRSGEPSPRGALLELASIRATSAGRRQHIVELDALYLLGFGPRAPEAARELLLGLYADRKAAAGSGMR